MGTEEGRRGKKDKVGHIWMCSLFICLICLTAFSAQGVQLITSNPWIHMKTKGKHLHLEPLRILVPLCYGNKAHASNQTGSLAPDSLQGSVWWGCVEEMRDHKLIMGSTQCFPPHLKSIIMQSTSVSLWQIESRQISTRPREEEDKQHPPPPRLFFLQYHLSLKTAEEMLMSGGRQQGL